MKHRIDDYRSFTGEHCGSVAMRGLLAHYCGLELREDVVFGLGAGVDCMLASLPGLGSVAFGRTATMEVDLARALGVAYSESTESDDEAAWNLVRDEVLAGRPTMLSGDIFYLDYREFKVHFPGHRFVLLGFDDEASEVYIADRVREEAETCSLDALMRSRNPKDGVSTNNLWGRFAHGRMEHDLVTAARLAVGTCARRMLGRDEHEARESDGVLAGSVPLHGVAAIEALADEIPTWADREGSAGLAHYNASAIEKFGNGGGNFRRLYAGFLDWAHALDPATVGADAAGRSTEAADGWTALAGLLWKASEGEDTWGAARRQTLRIAATERALFESLASAPGA